MCSFQDRCWSTWTPKNLVEATLVIGVPFIDNISDSSRGLIFLCDLNNIKLVLSRLRVSLLTVNHSATSDSSVFIIWVRVSSELCEKKKEFAESLKRKIVM